MNPIPFNRPSLAGNELGYIAAAIAGGHASGAGQFTRRCHTLLQDHLSGARVAWKAGKVAAHEVPVEHGKR